MGVTKRAVCATCALLFLAAGAAYPLSLVREGQPRIKFNRLVAPDRVTQGQVFRLVAFVTPLQNIWEKEAVFLHLIKPDAVRTSYPREGWSQDNIVINANITPAIPSERWIVGEDVQLGPINFGIPYDLPPGKYLLQLGLFHTKDPAKKVYVREPYANEEIKDWVVGSIQVEQGKIEDNGGRVEVMLSDFETLSDVRKWESRRRGRIGLVSQALAGRYSGLFGFPAKAYLPVVWLGTFFETASEDYTNWNQYDYLEFLMSGEFTNWQYDASNVAIQVKDSGGARFQRLLKDIQKTKLTAKMLAESKTPEESGKKGEKAGDAKTLASTDPAVSAGDQINIESVAALEEKGKDVYAMRLPVADVAGLVDTTNVRELGFYATQLPPTGNWYVSIIVDNLKLVAERGLKPDWQEPFVVFEGLKCPKTVVAGDTLQVSASFSIARKFRREYSIFVHIIQEDTPHFWHHLEKRPFESTVFWKVGKIYTEGPMSIPIAHDAPPGKYWVNVGLYRTYEFGREVERGHRLRYVNIYKWSDGVYTEYQPSKPVDWIKQPYINATSKTQWTVGEVTILAKKRREMPAVETRGQEKQLEEIITTTEKEILKHPPPAKRLEGVQPLRELPSYEITE